MNEYLIFVEKPDPSDILHLGTPHEGMIPHSGRYVYGSGENAYQHPKDFLTRLAGLRNKPDFEYFEPKTGKTYTGETAIAKAVGLESTTQLRTQESLAKHEIKAGQIAKAKELSAKGMGSTAISKEIGVDEGTIRGWLKNNTEENVLKSQRTAEVLKDIIAEHGPTDIGRGAEVNLNISKEKLREAAYILEMEGYVVKKGAIPQITAKDQNTNITVIGPPGSPKNIAYDFDNIYFIHPQEAVTTDGGETFRTKYEYPSSMDPSRLQIVYDEEGGTNRDGLIEIRPGVKDLDLGNSHYAQVRILVGGDRYLKGMAVYGDDFPDGVDVRFHTNKSQDKSWRDVLKSTAKNLAKDPNNPFGTSIKEIGGQSHYYENGLEKLSLINKKSDEGDWENWHDTLPAQFLSKQPLSLIKRQLTLDVEDKRAEYQEILSIPNPEVRKNLLTTFANNCDKASYTLRGASFPNQSYQVMLPLVDIKDTEVFAPNYANGTRLALVRYPHQGVFEIPILTVNNKNPEGIKMLKGATGKDMVGVSHAVAAQLSGADYDGDTVMCIPQSSTVKITNRPYLKELEGFSDKMGDIYKKHEGMKVMQNTNMQMGMISNLITDMTLQNAPDEEVARAVKHAMVVIDAAKHEYDYIQSEKDNGIAELKARYQKQYDMDGNLIGTGGAASIISRAKSPVYVTKEKGSKHIDPETGELVGSGKPVTGIDYKTGEEFIRKEKITRMASVDDAYDLIGNPKNPHPKEIAYAEYANTMKDMANKARLSILAAGNQEYDPEAHRAYASEVASLDKKLRDAVGNGTLEKEAQARANAYVNGLKKANPGLKEDKKMLGKIKTNAIKKYRNELGAHRLNIDITPKEWEAIEKGAITSTKLRQILDKTDIDVVRNYATPKYDNGALPDYKIEKIRRLKDSGQNLSLADIAEAVGCSRSTVSKYLEGGS